MTNSDESALRTLFNLYAYDVNDTEDRERIGPHGLLHLLTDMNLDPMDRRVLILASKLKAQTQCEFSWTEWKEGLVNQRIKSAKDLRSMLDKLDADLQSYATFKEVYNFVFDYGKQPGSKFMHLDFAVQYWRILFKDVFALIDLWEEFLRKKQINGIPKDTWSLLLDFCFTIKPDLTNYDDDGAWPLVLDQFVDFAKNRK